MTDFAKKEHERQVNLHNTKNNPKTKYTMLAKLMEEVQGLVEAMDQPIGSYDIPGSPRYETRAYAISQATKRIKEAFEKMEK